MAVHRRLLGLPAPGVVEEVGDDPGYSFGGCLVVPGMPVVECRTCGRESTWGGQGDEGAWEQRPEPDRRVADAVTRYARRVRQRLGLAEEGVVSYAGLWLLLAALAPVVRADGTAAEGSPGPPAPAAAGEGGSRLAELLGLDVDEAAEAALLLLLEPHPTLAAALGAWSRVDVPADLGLPVPPQPLPDQAGLDAWASEVTRGLIDRFPAEVAPETLLVLASALVLEPRLAEQLREVDDDWLQLDGGVQTVVETRAAGLVAVAKPYSPDGVDVLSVIAAPEVEPERVWQAVDEVVALLDRGGLTQGLPPAAGGHAWRVEERRETFTVEDRDRLFGAGSWGPFEALWRSRLPRWSATSSTDLTEAPGVAEAAEALARRVPGLDGGLDCVQAARAEYDEDGFRAAAVTAMALAAGMPEMVGHTFTAVDLRFDRPHAVVAIARGGAWEGVPLVSCWVTPEHPYQGERGDERADDWP